MTWKEVFLPALLAVFAWYDIRIRVFPLWLTAGGAGAAVLYTAVCRTQQPGSLLGGVLIGGILLSVSLCGGAIGSGDGILFMITGLCLGFLANLNLLFLSSVMAAAAALVLIRTGRSRKTELPFAPFIWTASVLQLFLRGAAV